MKWGDENNPKVTLVGKGVCFDTGGLNIKPTSSMGLMKKDMGGAATVLGLAHMIMSLNLNVNLRVIIPAVENSISSNSFRPQDILISEAKIRGTAINFKSFTKIVPMGLIQLATKSAPPTSSMIKPKVTPDSMPIKIFQCKASDFIRFVFNNLSLTQSI